MGLRRELRRAANRVELEKGYDAHLALENADHSDAMYSEFLTGFASELCPVGGVITYTDGHVECSVHSDEDAEEEDSGDDGGVPYL